MPNTTYCNLTQLKHRLNIQPVNTGRQFSLGGRNGIVTDDMEALHAIQSISGDCIHLVSGQEFTLFEYRGQTQDYGGCFSTLDRIQSDSDLLLALCRAVYFEQALATHPKVQTLQNLVLNIDTKVVALPICIDLAGIAQHYGLATEYLDVTRNFDVASFFATQRWNPNTKKFEPMRMSSKPGVIYKLNTVFLTAPTGKTNDIPYVPVGWQPFPRPEEQRANAIRLKPGEDFATSMPVAKYYFHHSRSQSKRIYEEFEGGNTLMPSDDLAELADQVQRQTIFNLDVIKRAFKRYAARRNPISSDEDKEAMIKKAGIELEGSNNTKFGWNFNQEEFDKELKCVVNRIRFRLAVI